MQTILKLVKIFLREKRKRAEKRENAMSKMNHNEKLLLQNRYHTDKSHFNVLIIRIQILKNACKTASNEVKCNHNEEKLFKRKLKENLPKLFIKTFYRHKMSNIFRSRISRSLTKRKTLFIHKSCSI